MNIEQVREALKVILEAIKNFFMKWILAIKKLVIDHLNKQVEIEPVVTEPKLKKATVSKRRTKKIK